MPDHNEAVLQRHNPSGMEIAVFAHSGLGHNGNPPSYTINHDVTLVAQAGPVDETRLKEIFKLVNDHLHGVPDIRTSKEHNLKALLKDGPDFMHSGSTALLAIVQNNTIITANLGDCRATLVVREPEDPVLGKVGILRHFQKARQHWGERITAHMLTEDQNINNPTENARVQSLGASVFRGYFVQLSDDMNAINATQGIKISGCLGNHYLDDMAWLRREPVVKTFDLSSLNLRPGSEVFLVIESDGCHRDHSPEVRGRELERSVARYAQESATHKMALMLGEDAINDIKNSDNTTVMVARVQRSGRALSSEPVLLGVFDGNGEQGHAVAATTRDLFKEHLAVPAPDVNPEIIIDHSTKPASHAAPEIGGVA